MATRNARKEVEDFLLACGEDMSAAWFSWLFDAPMFGKEQSVTLPLGYTADEREQCMKFLDVEYDNSFGCQVLEGFIWLADGTWIERQEYDGSEWWRRVVRPKMPTRATMECYSTEVMEMDD
tara:strand:- start:311 stop:676 length:366 start_codon:yes stop_codon:yes gene_type:complete